LVRFTARCTRLHANTRIHRAGRWRSEYIVDLDENKVNGRVLVNVHYYEQGNVRDIFVSCCTNLTHLFGQVQLSTTHAISLTFPPVIVISPASTAASKILALIEDEEGKYQTSLNETYHEMGEKTFKGLRRALPLTRQKLDWDKVHYSPGLEGGCY
jgi:capping protein (actin filament) muscle Z-line, alpha